MKIIAQKSNPNRDLREGHSRYWLQTPLGNGYVGLAARNKDQEGDGGGAYEAERGSSKVIGPDYLLH